MHCVVREHDVTDIYSKSFQGDMDDRFETIDVSMREPPAG